jgi:hypothetical protein
MAQKVTVVSVACGQVVREGVDVPYSRERTNQ